jgi:hypothetical protein
MARYIARLVQVKAHPPAVGQKMMRLRAPGAHDFISDPGWKRNIQQVITVYVADLAPANAELDAAEAVRMRRHARPRECGSPNTFACSSN